MNEITNMDLFDILVVPHLRQLAAVHGGLGGDDGEDYAFVPDIRRAVRWRNQAYAYAHGLGDVVQPGVMPFRGHRGRPLPHGEREAAGRLEADVRHMGDEFDWKAAKARWAACPHNDCDGWQVPFNTGCLDRQRAGTCPALAGGDLRPHPGGVSSVGRETE